MYNQDRQYPIQQNPSIPFAPSSSYLNYSASKQSNPSMLQNQSSLQFNRTAREQTMNDPLDNNLALQTVHSNPNFQASYENPVSVNEEYKVNQQYQQDRMDTYQNHYSPVPQNFAANAYDQIPSINQNIPSTNIYGNEINTYNANYYDNAAHPIQYQQPPIISAQTNPIISHVQVTHEPIITRHIRSYSYEKPPIPAIPSPAFPRISIPLPISSPPLQPPLENENIVFLNASLREYQEKCEQYQFQLNKMREFIREQDNIISSKMSLVDTIQSEVNIIIQQFSN